MLELGAALLGFLSPFIPQMIKIAETSQENKHELAMMQVTHDMKKSEWAHQADLAEAAADAAETQYVYQPTGGQHSYGKALLDGMEDTGWPMWVMAPILYMFGFLDFLVGAVRPIIAYAAFGFYMVFKWALYDSFINSGIEPDLALVKVWTDTDYAILMLILAHYFGNRIAKYAFGWREQRPT